IDDRIALEIESNDCTLQLVFKTECYLQVANRIRHRLMAADPATLTPLLPVIHQPLVRFMVASSGTCKLLLADSTVIWTDTEADWASHGKGTLVSASFNAAVVSPEGRTPRLALLDAGQRSR
ncbi:MAG: hypothetical protein AAFU71_13300, partial [Cyanobacteria bacterium J06632_22]